MSKEEWRKRMWSRMDETTQLTHLTKACHVRFTDGKEEDWSAFDTLFHILKWKVLIPADRKSFVRTRVVCFQEVSLFCLSEHMRYDIMIEGAEERYEPYGIRMDKQKVFEKGGLPVIYSQSRTQDCEKKDFKWRYVRMQIDNNTTIDFSHEREWRTPNEIKFEYTEISIVLPDRKARINLINRCDKEGLSDIYKKCRSVIVLADVYD